MNYLNIDELNKLDILYDQKQGDFIHCQRQFSINGQFSFTSREKITSTADVAFILKDLQEYGIEHSFACYVLKDNTPVVLHLGMGDYTSCVVNADIIKYTCDKLDAKQVYMAHNHPSGQLVFGNADRIQHDRCQKVLGQKFAGSLVINTLSGKFAFIDGVRMPEIIDRIPDAELTDSPIQILEFDRQVFSKDFHYSLADKILGPHSVAAFVSSQKFGEREKMGLISINRAMIIMANIQMPISNITPSKTLEIAEYMQKCISVTGGTAGILYSNADLNVSLIRRLAREFSSLSRFDLLDVCGYRNARFQSAAEDGLLMDPSMNRQKGMRL